MDENTFDWNVFSLDMILFYSIMVSVLKILNSVCINENNIEITQILNYNFLSISIIS